MSDVLNMDDMIADAERMGKEMKERDERNKKRRAKGKPPLPDIQEVKDLEVRRRRHRTGDATTVTGAEAMKLYLVRKAEMEAGSDSDPEDIDEIAHPSGAGNPAAPHAAHDAQTEAAIKAAESARRVQDMKGGRIDHAGNWSAEGQKLEGGDQTKLAAKPELQSDAASKAWGAADNGTVPGAAADCEKPVKKGKGAPKLPAADFEAFRNDLYNRLRISFEALETSLSDLQGRVAEIVTATTPAAPEALPQEGQESFADLLARKTPVVFDVGGTRMTFDAICVFHAKPCITVVSKIGSAQITPKPGATLNLTYEMEGKTYANDPVTYLGTRFDLPMFGLSFVGFIRDEEAGQMDVDAGVAEEAAPGAGE